MKRSKPPKKQGFKVIAKRQEGEHVLALGKDKYQYAIGYFFGKTSERIRWKRFISLSDFPEKNSISEVVIDIFCSADPFSAGLNSTIKAVGLRNTILNDLRSISEVV